VKRVKLPVSEFADRSTSYFKCVNLLMTLTTVDLKGRIEH